MDEQISLRTLLPSDQHAHIQLKSQAFGQGRVISEEEAAKRDITKTTASTGIFADDELIAALTVLPFDVHWPGAVEGRLPMGGIAGVATSIEARGRGYVDQLLRDSLARMRDAGQVVSALNPFAWAFYRRFGWDWVGEVRKTVLPLKELKSAPEGKHVRRIPNDEAQAVLSPVYDRYMAKYRGAFLSGSHQWSSSVEHADGRTTYVYGYYSPDSGDLEGYLIWRYSASGNEVGDVRQFIATTPAAYRALLSVLHYLATQCQTGRVVLPVDTPIWHHVMHWDLQTTVQPTFMGRVVDVRAAMESLLAPAGLGDGASVTFWVRDPIATWNNAAFTVTVREGRIVCEAAAEETPADVTLDIQPFSQAFWGSPSLSSLNAAGKVTVTDATGFDVLSRLLPATPVFTSDFF